MDKWWNEFWLTSEVRGEVVTNEIGARKEIMIATATGEDIGRRSPELPGWPFVYYINEEYSVEVDQKIL